MNPAILNGRYHVLQQLGAGGFGFTYLAEDVAIPARPRVVVKHLRPQIADAASVELAARLFNQEAEVLYRLGRHPNIPALIAHFKDRGEFFLVQEFIDGHALDREFRAGARNNQAGLVSLVGQVLEVLAFVHSEGVIHRDIKPANLMRRASDGAIALIDFGAVRRIGAPSESCDVAVGSHGYMPTEQMAGQPLPASDLYGLGLVAIESLTGIPPLRLERTQSGEIVWTSAAPLAPELARFVSKLVRMDHHQRFPSASEALAAFNRIADRIGFVPSPNDVVPATYVVQPIAAAPPPNAAAAVDAFVPPTLIVNAESAPRIARPASNAIQPPTAKPASWRGVLAAFVFIAAIIGGVTLIKSAASPSAPAADQPQTPAAASGDGPLGEIDDRTYQNYLYRADAVFAEARVLEAESRTREEWQRAEDKYRELASVATLIGRYRPNEKRVPILLSKAADGIARCREARRSAGA